MFYCLDALVMFNNTLPSNTMNFSVDRCFKKLIRVRSLISRARTTYYARRECFCLGIATFSVLNIYLNITQTKRMTSLLLLNHFYPVIYRRVRKEKESDELRGSVIRYGPRTSCQRKRLKAV